MNKKDILSITGTVLIAVAVIAYALLTSSNLVTLEEYCQNNPEGYLVHVNNATHIECGDYSPSTITPITETTWHPPFWWYVLTTIIILIVIYFTIGRPKPPRK